MFEHMKIAESIYESVVTPYFKKLLGHKPTILESVGIREDKTPCQTLTPQKMGALASAVNDMLIARRAHQKLV